MSKAGNWVHFGFYALEYTISIPMHLEDPIKQLEDCQKNCFLILTGISD